MKTLTDDTLTLTQAAGAFAALGSEQRLTILQALVRAGPDGVSIGELGDRTAVTGSTLTHHLKILVTAGRVVQPKMGRSIVCAAADYEAVEALSAFLMRNCCQDSGGTITDQGHSHV
jgi:DNA-binding transcriptional ArsR family regulator